jgi:hypothetical protein
LPLADTIAKRRENPSRELDRERGPAAAADAGQCQQSRLVEQRRALVEIVFLADETGQVLWACKSRIEDRSATAPQRPLTRARKAQGNSRQRKTHLTRTAKAGTI